MIKRDIKGMIWPTIFAYGVFVLFAIGATFAEASNAPVIQTNETCLRIYTGSVTDIKIAGAVSKSLSSETTYNLGDTSFACSNIASKIQGNFPIGSIIDFSSSQNSYFPLTYEYRNGGWVLLASTTITVLSDPAMTTSQVLQYYGIFAAFILAFASAFGFYKGFILRRP